VIISFCLSWGENSTGMIMKFGAANSGEKEDIYGREVPPNRSEPTLDPEPPRFTTLNPWA